MTIASLGDLFKDLSESPRILTGREAVTLSNIYALLPPSNTTARAREALIRSAAGPGGRGVMAARQASSARLMYWAQGHKTPKP